MAVVKLTHEQFIAKNLKFSRNVMGWWQASFTCADGYQISVSDSGTGRAVKGALKDKLIQAVLSRSHPVQ